MARRFSNIKGQSILEIIIALAVGAILIVGAVTALSSSLRVDTDITGQQTALFLSQELINNVSNFANSNWRNIYDLAKSPTKFHLTVTAGSFATSSGTEAVSMNNIDFTRYFTVESVSRNGGSIEAVYNIANDDPSTQKVNVFTTWVVNGDTATSSLQKYLTRHGNLVFVQTDWNDGATYPTVEKVTLPNSTYKKFATSTSIATTTGAIKIEGL